MWQLNWDICGNSPNLMGWVDFTGCSVARPLDCRPWQRCAFLDFQMITPHFLLIHAQQAGFLRCKNYVTTVAWYVPSSLSLRNLGEIIAKGSECDGSGVDSQESGMQGLLGKSRLGVFNDGKQEVGLVRLSRMSCGMKGRLWALSVWWSRGRRKMKRPHS